MTASEKLIAFIRNTFDTALYFAVMAVKENFRNYIVRARRATRRAGWSFWATALRCRTTCRD
mgnify:CR=1 FL=1